MMKVHLLALMVLGSALGATFAETNENHHAVIGTWQSTQLGGSDIGDHIVRVQCILQTNGVFSMTALMKDSPPIGYTGTFCVKADKLRFSIPEKGTNDMPFTLTNGLLTIRDPKLDSWIVYRKEVEPGGAANGSQPIRSETNRTSGAAGPRR